MMKLMIVLCATLGGFVGGWIGAVISGGNWFSGWSILLGALGTVMGVLPGIWIGYRLSE